MTEDLGVVDLLIVDDEDAPRRALERLLQREGFVVRGASGGSEALARIEAGLTPKVIFSDFVMPDMNGAELIQRLRQRPELRSVPVYLMSGSHERLASASGHFEKPFDAAAMVEVLKKHCR